MPGGSPLLEVGKTQDFELSKCPVRVFWPKGTKPEGGWNAFIFFHGGTCRTYVVARTLARGEIDVEHGSSGGNDLDWNDTDHCDL